ncbi:MAG: carbohydrate-binding protein [Chthonomonadaceae bacterium]|nr:carbohydrate-binding protein [Chthonomonadaceae bacterium]
MMMPVRTHGSGLLHHQNTQFAVAGFAALLALTALGMRPAQEAASGKKTQVLAASPWVSVSDGVLKQLAVAGKEVGYPGGTAGVSVDRVTGDVNMIVADQGVWRRSLPGTTFARVDDGNIGGRCETGYALNADPAGKRIAFFMLDGKSGITLDNGHTWSAFQSHGRGWDFGVVDWSRILVRDVLAVHHESGGELYRSVDAGQNWQLLGKDFTAIGIFDLNAYVASKGDGILRSADGGASWTKVSDLTPTGRTLCVFNGVGYWLTQEGLLTSKDRGKTWQKQGSPLESAWGPFFGKDENEIAVVGRRGKEAGIWQTEDAGKTWKLVAPFPQLGANDHPDWTPSKQWAAGWFYNFGWDWKNNTFYASHMGNPTCAFKVK